MEHSTVELSLVLLRICIVRMLVQNRAFFHRRDAESTEKTFCLSGGIDKQKYSALKQISPSLRTL
jgi:hypothetical protein